MSGLTSLCGVAPLFEPKEHLTDRCFDDQVLRALQESPFPAVYLILEDRGRDGYPEG